VEFAFTVTAEFEFENHGSPLLSHQPVDVGVSIIKITVHAWTRIRRMLRIEDPTASLLAVL
jgi:hypothetical protein